MKIHNGLILYKVLGVFVLFILALVLLQEIKITDIVEKKIFQFRMQSLKQCTNQNDNNEIASYAMEILIDQLEFDDNQSISVAYLSPEGRFSACNAGYNMQGNRTNTDTVYQIASVTKLFTADATLELVRLGKFSLDSKIIDLLPELYNKRILDQRVKDITVEHLLTHSAGFDRETQGVTDVMFSEHPWCPYDLEQLTKLRLDFTPGERYAYSNIGYCLLGKIIEKYSGKKFNGYILEKYFIDTQERAGFLDSRVYELKNSAIKTLIGDYNYEALNSSASMYVSSKALVHMLDETEKNIQPNISSVSKLFECDNKMINGCVTLSGHKYSLDDKSIFFWKDGSLPNVTSLAITEENGGILVFMTNERKPYSDLSTFIAKIYNYKLNKSNEI